MWAQIRAKAKLPDKRHYIEHMHCFMGRLRTELFPFRPRISIMVQFWKRQDQMVEKLVRSVERCSKQVGHAPWQGTGAAHPPPAGVCTRASGAPLPLPAEGAARTMYHTKGWFLTPLVLAACGQQQLQVPLELVVNVDNPAQHDLWLDWAYNRTQGLVVPVFSQNVHEKRCADSARHCHAEGCQTAPHRCCACFASRPAHPTPSV